MCVDESGCDGGAWETAVCRELPRGLTCLLTKGTWNYQELGNGG